MDCVAGYWTILNLNKLSVIYSALNFEGVQYYGQDSQGPFAFQTQKTENTVFLILWVVK